MTKEELLIESADELAWLHRQYMEKVSTSQGIPRIIRLLDEIEKTTGHKTNSPFPPSVVFVNDQ